MSNAVLYTIGHGDRTLDELLECLRSFDVEMVVDVRSYPASRHHPHFGRERLEPAVTAAGFTYRWMGRDLGGFRSEGYAAHMQTDLFAAGLGRLMGLARGSSVAILCAERDPAGCHRLLIAKALSERGFTVKHIIEPGRVLLPGERPEDQGTLFPID